MAKPLTAHVAPIIIEELEVRADCLDDTAEDTDIESSESIDAAMLRSAIAKIKKGEKPSANELQVVNDEMMVIESADAMIEIWREWCCAMAWLGLLDKYDSTAVYSGRKPKRIKIDGVEYECGEYR